MAEWKSAVQRNDVLHEWPTLDQMKIDDVAKALASVDMMPGLIDNITEHKNETRPCNTNGRWFHLDLSKKVLDDFFRDDALWSGDQANWQTAYHGTALHNLPKILLEGLQKGPNSVADKRGVYEARIYCEGEKRRMCAYMYSTHVAVPYVNPNLFFGCLLELLVDRTRGDTMHRQWRQRDGSVHLTGAWVHVLDVRRAYDAGYVGTYRIDHPQLKLGLAKAVKGHFLRDVMEYHIAEKTGDVIMPLSPKPGTLRNVDLYDDDSEEGSFHDEADSESSESGPGVEKIMD